MCLSVTILLEQRAILPAVFNFDVIPENVARGIRFPGKLTHHETKLFRRNGLWTIITAVSFGDYPAEFDRIWPPPADRAKFWTYPGQARPSSSLVFARESLIEASIRGGEGHNHWDNHFMNWKFLASN